MDCATSSPPALGTTAHSNEAEWLAAAISDAIVSVCSLDFAQSPNGFANVENVSYKGCCIQANTLAHGLFSLPSIVSVPNTIAPIPAVWGSSEEIMVADEFPFLNESGGGTILLGRQVPTVRQLHSPVPDVSASAPADNLFDGENIASTTTVPSHWLARLLPTTERPDTAPGPVKPPDSSQTQVVVTATPAKQLAGTTGGETSRFREESPESRKKDQIRHFGETFFETALQRLGLPADVTAQVKRLQGLSRPQPDTNILAILEEEKARVKQQLKEYDALFLTTYGRTPQREEKEPLRNLYMYYRRVKISIQKTSSRQGDEGIGANPGPVASGAVPETGAAIIASGLQKLSAVWTAEEKRLIKLQEEKTAIRAKLQKYQEEFVRDNGRPIKYHRDVVKIENEYKQYKQLKEHIKKLEDLIRRKRSLRAQQSTIDAGGSITTPSAPTASAC